eukprot:3969047-Alexandrium_andersonii.AAC.1
MAFSVFEPRAGPCSRLGALGPRPLRADVCVNWLSSAAVSSERLVGPTGQMQLNWATGCRIMVGPIAHRRALR